MKSSSSSIILQLKATSEQRSELDRKKSADDNNIQEQII
jgi:hypothetical protein